jgi:hypothetical protein
MVTAILRVDDGWIPSVEPVTAVSTDDQFPFWDFGMAVIKIKAATM